MKLKALGFILFLLLMTVWFPLVRADNALIQPSTQDSDIWENVPINFGDSNLMDAGNVSGNIHRALVAFDLSSIPVGSTINSANLTLTRGSYTGDPTNRIYWVYRITQSWTENIVTWSTRNGGSWVTPGGDYTTEGGASSQLQPGSPIIIAWNVKEIVKAWIENGENNYGFLIKDGNETTSVSSGFYTKENPFYTPKLDIDYTPPLPTPEEHHPVGGEIAPINSITLLAPLIAVAIATIAIGLTLSRKKLLLH